ncbi:MAG: hypothetical protein ABI643_04315, partial [Candidatus Doudnabacteria bacterium]
MFIRAKKYTIVLLLAVAMVAGGSLALADTTPAQLSQNEKTLLQQQLQNIENQIAQYQQQLNEVKGQKNTLQNKVSQLKKQLATLELQAKATNLEIADINNQLSITQRAFDQNAAKAESLKNQIGDAIKLVAQQDDYSLLSILLSQDNLSSALTEMETYSQISQNLKSLLDQRLDTNNQLGEYKQKLDQQHEEDRNLLSIQSLQKAQIAGATIEQNTLLDETKGKEANYQAVLSDTQKQAAEIRGRLYQLLGISTQITFGQAV